MFVRDFIHVDQPFEVVAPRFVSDTSWLAPIAEDAALVVREVAQALAGGATPGPGDTNGAASLGAVRCDVGPVRALSDSILVPMWIVNLAGAALLPDLSGDLEIAPAGTDRSVIALNATYRRISHERDELVRIERATEAGVRTFLSGIAGHLGRPRRTV